MKTRLLTLLSLSLFLMAPLAESAAPQRSRGTPSRSSVGGSSASRSSPVSRGAPVSRGSSISRGSSSGFSGQSSSRSISPRSTSGGLSRPSAPSPSSSSSLGSRSVTLPSRSIQSSRPTTSLGSRSLSTTRPASPSAGSGLAYPRPPASTSPDGTGRSVFSGQDLYSGRTTLGEGVSTTRPSFDSAPTAGQVPGARGDGSSAGTATGWPTPTARTQPRVRFPAPYQPAGSAGDIGGSVGGRLSPTSTTVAPSGRGAASADRPASTGGSGSLGGRTPGLRDSGPRVRYDRGPTERIDTPTVTSGKAAPRPSKGSSAIATGKGSGKGGGTANTGKAGGAVRGTLKGSGERKVTSWRDAVRSDPKGAKQVTAGVQLAGRAHTIATGIAAGAIGGVYPGDYVGSSSWACDPWGSRAWVSFGFGFGYNYGYCSYYPWWSYCSFWSWYYPCWWWYSRPYYYSSYCYYRPITTVVYSDPQVVYVNGSGGYADYYEEEPVGEAVLSEPANVQAPTLAPSPLSIAAQRYLELGDRAFREGRYTDAVQFYAKAVEFAPDQGALYLVLADALFAAGDYHYGAYAIRRALELDPALIETRIDKHSFYPDPSLFDQQLVRLETYLNTHQSDRDARLVLALNYLFGGRAAEAVRMIEDPASGLLGDVAAQRVLAQARLVAR